MLWFNYWFSRHSFSVSIDIHYVSLLHSVNVENYVRWFLSVKPTLYFWNIVISSWCVILYMWMFLLMFRTFAPMLFYKYIHRNTIYAFLIHILPALSKPLPQMKIIGLLSCQPLCLRGINVAGQLDHFPYFSF